LQIKALEKFLGSSSKKSAVSSPDADGYIPLKSRLTAWWHGNDTEVTTKKFRKTDNRVIEIPESLDALRWSPDSILMVQKLWGEGFAEPGGPGFAKKILSPIKFDSSNTILDLSAGLGGTACILAKEHKLWLDAYEPNATLATAGSEFSSRHGMSKKVPIKHMDFETLDLPKKKYDLIYSRESLYMVTNKKNIIKQIAKSLKHKGQILITDYVLGEKNNPASVKKWVNSEPEKPHPWTLELYQTALDHYGISVWSISDLSKEYLEQIHAGWLETVDKVAKGDFDRNSVNMLMREGEIWLNRARAIETGDLTIQRIHGVI